MEFDFQNVIFKKMKKKTEFKTKRANLNSGAETQRENLIKAETSGTCR